MIPVIGLIVGGLAAVGAAVYVITRKPNDPRDKK